MNELTVKRIKNFIDQNHLRNIEYVIYHGEKAVSITKVKLPETQRLETSTKIINQSRRFVNGYKVVQTENGEYGYVAEENNELLPYRYDLALDFNDYGYAIVAKDGNVTWINKRFEHLNIAGHMVKEFSTKKSWTKMDGWLKVSEFSKGSIPLSKVCDNKTQYGEQVAYFNTDGHLQGFYEYGSEDSDDYPKTYFTYGTSFDETNSATAENYLLLAKGYYVTYNYLINFCKQKGFIDILSEEAHRTPIRTLKK